MSPGTQQHCFGFRKVTICKDVVHIQARTLRIGSHLSSEERWIYLVLFGVNGCFDLVQLHLSDVVCHIGRCSE